MPRHVVKSVEIGSRLDFPSLMTARGYTDAVEIGVDQGVFAKHLLTHWQGRRLFGVDNYEPYVDFDYDRSGDMAYALLALAPFHGRFRLVKAPSARGAAWIRTIMRPQFIYIDGAHDEQCVAADLRAWWGVLADDDGMLAGHDYDETHPGVIQAVNDFADEHDLVIRTTHENECASWYCYRQEPHMLLRGLFRDPNSGRHECLIEPKRPSQGRRP